MRYPLAPYDRCSFCHDLSGGRECAFVAQNELAAAEIDLRQYETGAMLVIPRAHRESILDITPEELDAVYRLALQVGRAATLALGAVGMNVYQNNGIKAGQHEPHFHVHVVPRYEASDPDRLFRQRDYPPVPLHERHGLAARIRSALQEIPAA
jgi:histidine triad (HIT) family protein